MLQLVLFALHSSADCVPGVGGCRAALANGRVDAYAVKFIPQAVAGGVLWATGNTMAVPVISSIGLGMGMLIWGTTNMLMGWATGMARLDRNSASPGLVWLNVTGVGLALLALALYTLIRPDAAKEQPAAMRDELLLQAGSAGGGVLGAGAAMDARPARRSRRLSGILLALLSGILYGNNFTPPNLLLNTGQGPSNALDYVFSHFCGIYFASTVRMRACSHLNPDTTNATNAHRTNQARSFKPNAEPEPASTPCPGQVYTLASYYYHSLPPPGLYARLLLLQALDACALPARHLARLPLRPHVGRRPDGVVRGQRLALGGGGLPAHHLRPGHRLFAMGRLRLQGDHG